ncbi:MAG: hypothetical protein A2782_00525 [Candidatus Blackburnbacteria bacterium RIFCSPHIGHO2_01_FULL_43_15b]|uniref:HEPN domain-containing protein n=1 Tax=Candidatus Blackburnbacteria bacterium RIFCSPHIGHO2_01_FULL_43_15b TaxID=1797513 RepID=A0A1G1UYQ0_9BACT|nr:MAG: hypothetical protein A2782_00525 [Candidatus Blackburnbacteria bacterium RIFCSPHIGHO2_01_FULL_43_15b]
MNEVKLAVGSLALDLKRTGLYLHQNALSTASGFEEEAHKRIKEISLENVDPYLVQLVKGAESVLQMPVTEDRKAEDAIMYARLLQNYTQKYL